MEELICLIVQEIIIISLNSLQYMPSILHFRNKRGVIHGCMYFVNICAYPRVLRLAAMAFSLPWSGETSCHGLSRLLRKVYFKNNFEAHPKQNFKKTFWKS